MYGITAYLKFYLYLFFWCTFYLEKAVSQGQKITFQLTEFRNRFHDINLNPCLSAFINKKSVAQINTYFFTEFFGKKYSFKSFKVCH